MEDANRQDFLKTLAEACQKTGIEVHAYCLIRNHSHLVIKTPEANLVAGMRWLLSAYTIRFNHRYNFTGHVFSGRYRALLVEAPRERVSELERMAGELGEHHAGALRRESAEVCAERIIAEELGRPGWTEADVTKGQKSDPVKLPLAARPKRQTTLTVGWMARRLTLGTRKSAAAEPHRWTGGTRERGVWYGETMGDPCLEGHQGRDASLRARGHSTTLSLQPRATRE